MQSAVLSSHFKTIEKVEEDTTQRIVANNPQVISTTLPDFVHNGGSNSGETAGKTIVFNNQSQQVGKTINKPGTALPAGKKP
jgi:hypothetical protein